LAEPVERRPKCAVSRKFRQSDFGSLGTEHIIIALLKSNSHFFVTNRPAGFSTLF
jgi:hypothetical protein